MDVHDLIYPFFDEKRAGKKAGGKIKHPRAPDEGTTPRVLTFGLPAAAQEQDEHLKPKKPKTN
jgi:hypothetical protein